MDVVALILGGVRVVFGFLFVLFIPGFTLSLVYFPRSTDLQPFDRLVYSTVLSISSVMVLVLFMEYVLGVNTTPRNIFLFICVLSVLALILWQVEKKYLNNTIKIPSGTLPSWDYHAFLKRYSRIVNSVNDRFRKNSTARIVYHENLASGSNQIEHSYLIDIGEEIEIQQIIEYNRKVCDCILLTPPHPRTRYFELFIREYAEDDLSRIEDLQVYPVLVLQKKPRGRIQDFLLHSVNWKITERLYKTAGTTKVQWIYGDDFHISAIIRPGDTLDLTVDRVIAKIDEITASIQRGSRITSYIENHLMRRKTFLAEMEKHRDFTSTKTEIIPNPEFPSMAELERGDCRNLQVDVLHDLMELGVTLETSGGSRRAVAKFKNPEKIDINKQLADMEKDQDSDKFPE